MSQQSKRPNKVDGVLQGYLDDLLIEDLLVEATEVTERYQATDDPRPDEIGSVERVSVEPVSVESVPAEPEAAELEPNPDPEPTIETVEDPIEEQAPAASECIPPESIADAPKSALKALDNKLKRKDGRPSFLAQFDDIDDVGGVAVSGLNGGLSDGLRGVNENAPEADTPFLQSEAAEDYPFEAPTHSLDDEQIDDVMPGVVSSCIDSTRTEPAPFAEPAPFTETERFNPELARQTSPSRTEREHLDAFAPPLELPVALPEIPLPAAADPEPDVIEPEPLIAPEREITEPAVSESAETAVVEAVPENAESQNSDTGLQLDTESSPLNWQSGTGVDCLIFVVCGLKLAIPLPMLGGVHKVSDRVVPLFGQASWSLGVWQGDNSKLTIIDSAQLMMPERKRSLQDEGYEYFIQLDRSPWAVACQEICDTVKLNEDAIKWRGERSKRPWLAGTVIDEMCALIDVPGLMELLEDNVRPAAKRVQQ